MFPNYFNRVPMCPMMGNPVGETPMTGMPPADVAAQQVELPPVPGFGTGAPDFDFQPGPPIQDDINYTQGYLQTKIGSYVKLEFLIGTNLFIDREGILAKVGISYVVLLESGTGNELLCDIYSIKFVTFFNGDKKC